MALKVISKCSNCKNKCKKEVDETVWKNADIVFCPSGTKFIKK